jgi:prolyl-tRNA synthetase
MIGAIIMTHGDDKGLVLPPRLAPIQVVVVPIYRNDTDKTVVMEAANRIFSLLKTAGIRLKMDDREEVTPGFKYNDWEMRGVPLRLEIGPKDVEKSSVALARRDRPGKEGKSFVPQENLVSTVADLLTDIQTSMLAKATAFRDSHIHDPKDLDELTRVTQNGWAYSWWCESKQCENLVKETSKASTRCMPVDQPAGNGNCIVCGQPAKRKVLFGKSY